MNYEKEYKEAFKRAERRFDHNPTDGYAGYANGIIEDIFPQFIKREDERTRKEILDFIKRFWADHKESIPRISSWLVWLEKQKECVTDSSETAANEDERIRKGLIEALKASKTVGELKFIFPEPTREECIAYLEKQKEQKPAEWSEDIIRKAVKEVGLTQHQINWFETNVFPPKQEWSEEDEDMLNSCISSIEEAKENRYAYKETDGDTSYDHEIAWLKSLRNRVGKEFLQPHWKPSEHQITILKAVKEYVGRGSGYWGEALGSLIEDLEKL